MILLAKWTCSSCGWKAPIKYEYAENNDYCEQPNCYGDMGYQLFTQGKLTKNQINVIKNVNERNFVDLDSFGSHSEENSDWVEQQLKDMGIDLRIAKSVVYWKIWEEIFKEREEAVNKNIVLNPLTTPTI